MPNIDYTNQDSTKFALGTWTILNGQSLSDAIVTAGRSPFDLQLPASLDGATTLTFQTCIDGTTFQDLYDETNTEFTVTVGVSRNVSLPASYLLVAQAIKIRLGTGAVPVVATADRVIKVALKVAS